MPTEADAVFVQRYCRDNNGIVGMVGCEQIEVRSTRRVLLLSPDDLFGSDTERTTPPPKTLRDRLRERRQRGAL